jgi:hypothetical protein
MMASHLLFRAKAPTTIIATTATNTTNTTTTTTRSVILERYALRSTKLHAQGLLELLIKYATDFSYNSS